MKKYINIFASLAAVVIFYLLCIETIVDYGNGYNVISVILTALYIAFWIYVLFISKKRILKYLSLVYSIGTIMFCIIIFAKFNKILDSVVSRWFFTMLLTLFAIPFNGLRAFITDPNKLLNTGIIISSIWFLVSIAVVIKLRSEKEKNERNSNS